MSDVFPAGYSNAARAEKPRIFLNENLTNYRRGLVSRASEMKKRWAFDEILDNR